MKFLILCALVPLSLAAPFDGLGDPSIRPDDRRALLEQRAQLQALIDSTSPRPLVPQDDLPVLDLTNVRPEDQAALLQQQADLRGIIASSSLAGSLPHRPVIVDDLPVLDLSGVRPDDRDALLLQQAELRGLIANSKASAGRAVASSLPAASSSFANSFVRPEDQAALNEQQAQLDAIVAGQRNVALGVPAVDFSSVRPEDRAALLAQQAQLREIINGVGSPVTTGVTSVTSGVAGVTRGAEFVSEADRRALLKQMNDLQRLIDSLPAAPAAPAQDFSFAEDFSSPAFAPSASAGFDENAAFVNGDSAFDSGFNSGSAFPSAEEAQRAQLEQLGHLIAENQRLHHNGVFPTFTLG